MAIIKTYTSKKGGKVKIKILSHDSKNQNRRISLMKVAPVLAAVGVLGAVSYSNLSKKNIEESEVTPIVNVDSNANGENAENKDVKVSDNMLPEQNEINEDVEKQYIVVNPNSYLYGQLPNETEKLVPGDVVEFERAFVGSYEKDGSRDNRWKVVSDATKDSEKWCFCMHRETGNYGYISAGTIQEFKPYDAKSNAVYYKNQLTDITYNQLECNVGDTVYVDPKVSIQDKSGDILYKILIQDEIDAGTPPKYDYYVGYADISQLKKSEKEFSLGLVTDKTFIKSSPEVNIVDNTLQIGEKINVLGEEKVGNETWYIAKRNQGTGSFYVSSNDVAEYTNENIDVAMKETGVKYIVDISTYDIAYYPDYLNMLYDLDRRNLLGGVMMEIARSTTGNSLNVEYMSGNDKLDNKVDAFKEELKNGTIGSMAEYESFKMFVKKTMEICPVGYYVFTDVLDINHANVLAEVIHETEKQLAEDIPGYNEAKKLPIAIDIETGKDEDRQRRTNVACDFINKLGEKGVIQNQYMLYTMPSAVAAKKENSKNGSQITSIEEICEKTSNYNMINFGTLLVDGVLRQDYYSSEIQDCLDPNKLLKKMYANEKYTTPGLFSFVNVAQVDIMQCVGNVNKKSVDDLKLKRQVIDFSVCTTEVYEQILDNNFRGHTGTFLGNMTNAIENSKYVQHHSNMQNGGVIQNNRVIKSNEDIER